MKLTLINTDNNETKEFELSDNQVNGLKAAYQDKVLRHIASVSQGDWRTAYNELEKEIALQTPQRPWEVLFDKYYF